MSAQNKAVGRGKCLVCGEALIVRENQSGGHNWGCGLCDVVVRTKKGTMAHNKLSKFMNRIAQDAPAPATAPAPAPAPATAPAPAPAPATAPAPAPAAAKTIFGI